MWKVKSEQNHSIIITFWGEEIQVKFHFWKKKSRFRIHAVFSRPSSPAPSGITVPFSRSLAEDLFLLFLAFLGSSEFPFRLKSRGGALLGKAPGFSSSLAFSAQALGRAGLLPPRRRHALCLEPAPGTRSSGADGRARRGALWGAWSGPPRLLPEGGSRRRAAFSLWPGSRRPGTAQSSRPRAPLHACTSSPPGVPSLLCGSPEGRWGGAPHPWCGFPPEFALFTEPRGAPHIPWASLST